VVPLPARLLDDADDGDVLGDFAGGQHDAGVDLVGDVRDQRPGVLEACVPEGLGGLGVGVDHRVSGLVEVQRPIPVGFQDHVGDAAGVQFADQGLGAGGVRTDDHVVGQVVDARRDRRLQGFLE
jgi:hypothetical protein